MDLNSLTPEDHARRYALLCSICLGCFVLLACWMAAELGFVVSVLAGVVAGVLLFWPLRALMRQVFRKR